MDGWNTTFLLGFGLFSGATLVSGRLISTKGVGKVPPSRFFSTNKNVAGNVLKTQTKLLSNQHAQITKT